MRARFWVVLVLLACVFGGRAEGDCGPCETLPFSEVVLREDFTGTNGDLPDSERWVIGHPETYPNCWWTQGRTFFPDPVCHPAAPLPHIQDDACLIEQYRYNSYDLGQPRWTFLGGEIHTTMHLDPQWCYRIEARVKFPQAPRGLVASFFTYGYDSVHQDSDELDFEFLSNRVFDPPREVLSNPWDDSRWDAPVEKPVSVEMPPGFDLTNWQTLRIYWCPDECIAWTWIDPLTSDEVLLRCETDPAYIPDEPMNVYFNFWAPMESWTDAYDAALQPDQTDQGVKWDYWIDYVEVRKPEFAPGDANLDGAVTDADYTIWADHYGAPGASWRQGDFNDDGQVTDADYTIWADHYGETILPVPEPTALALVIAAFLLPPHRKGR
jgi:glycosyl hydrolase family 16